MTNSSRTILEPSPMNFCTSSDPDTRINVHSVWWATARASKVFPVPGGPYSNTPWHEQKHILSATFVAHQEWGLKSEYGKLYVFKFTNEVKQISIE